MKIISTTTTRIRVLIWLFCAFFYCMFSEKMAERIVRGYLLAVEEDSQRKLDELLKRESSHG